MHLPRRFYDGLDGRGEAPVLLVPRPDRAPDDHQLRRAGRRSEAPGVLALETVPPRRMSDRRGQAPSPRPRHRAAPSREDGARPAHLRLEGRMATNNSLCIIDTSSARRPMRPWAEDLWGDLERTRGHPRHPDDPGPHARPLPSAKTILVRLSPAAEVQALAPGPSSTDAIEALAVAPGDNLEAPAPYEPNPVARLFSPAPALRGADAIFSPADANRAHNDGRVTSNAGPRTAPTPWPSSRRWTRAQRGPGHGLAPAKDRDQRPHRIPGHRSAASSSDPSAAGAWRRSAAPPR